MEFYKTLKKVAVVGFLTALPTICEPSCAYKGNEVYAAETRQEVKQNNSDLASILETANLE